MSSSKTIETDTPSSVGSTVLSMMKAESKRAPKKNAPKKNGWKCINRDFSIPDDEESDEEQSTIVEHVLKNHWEDLPDLENARMRVEDMSLFVAHVSSYPRSHDEHVISTEIEEQVTRKVQVIVRDMRIGEIRRIDLKVNKNANTGEKYIDAFIHLYWFNNLPAKQLQAEINVYGRVLWPLKEEDRTHERPFLVVRKNNNPMTLEEVRLMKDLGAAIREMLAVHEEIKKKIHWPEMERYILDIDSMTRYDLTHAPHNSRTAHGQRFDFMWLKYIKCKEATVSMRFHL